MKENGMVLQCTSIINETHDMKTYTFNVLSNNLGEPKPGKHLLIDYPDSKGNMCSRYYSISTCDPNNDKLCISVKKENEIGVSNKIFNNLSQGMVLYIREMKGQAFYDIEGNNFFIFSSGSGITPAIALIKSIESGYTPKPKKLFIFYSSKSINKTAFFRYLLGMQEQYDWIEVNFFITEHVVSGKIPCLHYGRIQKIHINNILGLAKGKVYIFGGIKYVNYMKSITGFLEDNSQGYKEGNDFIKVDIHSLEIKSTLDIPKSSKTILDIIEDNGFTVKTGCRSGFCGACKIKLNNGTVSPREDVCLTVSEKQKGYILACNNYITSDVSLTLS